ncbi:nicotinamide mononucleotide transporter [Sphingomonas sp. HDW15A]|uniref:nicotinamide riboside transporter PnuC n=1 Tax=Sphingomonas sp. HDW15A TaxID=2714942 RepID=UPI00140D9AD3|nr:nicotinamide riboside transporter PnuC [Sphingomonas sp. HDW15A]QIK95661.1 nicotinamide mononucleotide transporter [Sphingomonas sp. HDW15A]
MGSLEIAAAILGVVTVFLVVRRSVWNYPFALAMVALYFVVFLEARLYSDALLQIFFFAINIYGWWAWYHAPRVDHGVEVVAMSGNSRLAWLAATLAASLGWGFLMARFTDAAAPFADAAVAGTSIAAQILQSLRRIETWVLWIAVDVGAIGLFWSRELLVTAGLYALFLVMSVSGLVEWKRRLA